MGNLAVAHLDAGWFYFPTLAGDLDQQLARSSRALADRRNRRWRSAAARCHAVIGYKTGIAQHQVNLADRHEEFFGGRLRQRSARALPHLGFACEHGDNAILADVNPGRHVAEPSAAAPASAGALRDGG